MGERAGLLPVDAGGDDGGAYLASPFQIKHAQACANLILYELVPRLKRHGFEIENSPVSPEVISMLAICKAHNTASTRQIRIFLDKFFDSSGKP